MNANYLNNTSAGGTAPQTAGTPGYHPIKILVRRRWQLFACLLLVCTMALASAFLARPSFQAASQVQIVSDSPDKLGGLTELLGGGTQGDYFDTQCKLIKSRKVLSEASRRMSNASEWSYNDNIYDTMKSKVQVVPISQSRLIEIIGIGESPSEAAAISNHVTAAFVDTMISDYKADTARVIRRIQNQIDGYDKNISEIEQSIQQYRQEHKIANPGAITRETETQIALFEKDIASLRMQQIDLVQRKTDLENLLANPTILESGQYYVKELSGNTRIANLDSEIRKLVQEETQLARIYLPGHDKLKAVREKLADLQNTRYLETVSLIEELYRQVSDQIDTGEEREKSLNQLLAQERDRNIELAGFQNEYGKLVTLLAENTQARQQLEQTLRKFEISESMKESPVVVVDSAHLPTKPVGLTAEHRAASILLLGLVFSIVFILSVERLTTNEPVESPQSAQPGMAPWNGWAWPSMIPQPVTKMSERNILGRIGRIDYASGESDRAIAARCRIVHVDAAGAASNGFREAGARLLSRFGRSHQSIVVTGSSHGSGKSTCASNLSLTIHQSQRQVVLVDCNPVSSPIALAYQYNRRMLDLSLFRDDPTLLEDYLSATDLPGLTILAIDTDSISAGHDGITTLALLQADLSARYDWVIYDSGLIGDPVTDRLLQIVGKAVHVNGAEDLDEPDMVMEQIENRGAVCVGCIDNRFFRYAPNRYPVNV